MGKRGKESPKRKDGNQDPKDNQQQPDIVPSKQIIVKQPDDGRRNTGSLLKSYSQVLKSSPQVFISWECQVLAIEALHKENITQKNFEFPKLEKSSTSKHVECPTLKKPSTSKHVECPKLKEPSTNKHVECPKLKDPSAIKQSSVKLNIGLCKTSPEKAIRSIERSSKKVETPVPRKSPRRLPGPKSDSCTTFQSIETSKQTDSSTSVSKNTNRRKALVRALTHVRKPNLRRRCKQSKPQRNSNQPCSVKRTLRSRKECPVTSIQKSLSVPPAKSSSTMDKPREEKDKEEENKNNSSNEASQNAEDKDSTNNQTNNESDSDSDDVEMQVLEKQVLSEKEEESDDENPSLHFPIGSDEESALLSPSALPASCLFRSASRRKKRPIPSTEVEHTALPTTQTHPFPLPPSTTSNPIATVYHSPYKTTFANREKFSRYSTASTSFASKLIATSLPSQYPGKRGRGRPRKALEDVKSVSGKLYRKKLAERLSAAGVGRGRPIYSPIQTTAIPSTPSTSYDQDRTPYDDNFDEDPMADNTLPPSDQDIGRRMQRWKNRSTFIYAKHKFRNNQDNENGSVKDKFMCKVCKVGFTALSSLKRHYGTIYHKQQEESGRSPMDFLGTSPERNPFNRDEFQLGRDPLLSTSSSSSPSLSGSRKDLGQRPSSQPRTSSIVRRNAVDNIKKYYAAADAARRRREGVDGVGGGTWIQKQQRRRKPLLHSDYIYQSSLPLTSMSMDDDSYLLDELELGEVRNEDEENNYPMEYDDLIRREEEAQSKTWLSNAWKGVGPPHFTCEFCHESHTSKREFTRHLFKHRQEEALTCPECQFRLPSEAALENHARLLCPGGISGARSRFKCNMCTSTFSRLEYFRYHLEIHMRPPVRCPHCPKKFSHKFFLQDHIKAMHEWTNHNGNGNGLAFTGVHTPGSVTETALTLTNIVVPPSSSSPRPKMELFCPGSAPPLTSTDDRRKANLGTLSQNLPPIPQSPSSVNKKRNVSKPSATKSVTASKETLLSLSDSHTADLADRIDDQTGMDELNELSSTSNPRPRESVNVNLWKKYFHDEKSEEVNDSHLDGGIDMDSNLLADVEQSTTEDGNLVWQFKPTFDSGFEESKGNIPSLTIEIPRDNIDFGDERRSECKVEIGNVKLAMSSPDYHHQKLPDNAEQETGENQQTSVERQSLALGQNPVISGGSSSSNLTLIGCGCKSSVLGKPLKSPLVCQDCGKSFEHRKSLVKHVRYYSQSEDYHCMLCGKSFKLKHHVSRHMKSFHNVDTSSTSGAEDHYDMDALSSPSGSNSGGIMTPTEKESFNMITFEGKFTSSTSFHLSSKRVQSVVSKPSPKKIRKRLESSPAIPDPGLSSYSSSTTGCRKKASSVTSEPGGSVSSERLFSTTAVVDSDGISAFKCLICKKLYPSKAQLNSHMWYHKKKDANMPYKCTECSTEFKLKHELNIHQQQLHTIDSNSVKHTCAKCPAKHYANRKDLLKHMREKHSFLGRKPISAGGDDEGIASTDKIQVSRCPFCPLVFPRECDLKDHMGKEHMRCIACRDCGLVLGNKEQLQEHMEREHSRQESEEKEEDEEEDDDDDDDPPTPSPHTSPIHMPNFGRPEDDEDLEEEQEEEDEPQEDPESEFELLELN